MKVLLHNRTRAQVDSLVASGAGSYVFHGPRGLGKTTAAVETARRLGCSCHDAGICRACKQIKAGNYPDLIMVKPQDKPGIVIEQIRELVAALSLRNYYSDGTRVVVIDEADTMRVEAQNALLKVLEEPAAGTVFILITEGLEALLSTVRSRCQPVFFINPSVPETAKHLSEVHGLSPSDAKTLAESAAGAPGTALALHRNEAATSERNALITAADRLPGLPLFERLLLARELADQKADLAFFARRLHQTLVAGSISEAPATGSLEALEMFRRHLHAKVAPRVALEHLALELG